MSAADILADVPFDHAVVVTTPTEVVARHGEPDEIFPFASVTKLFSCYAALIALERGHLELDEEAGGEAPEGATVRHLFAHASGLPLDRGSSIGRVGQRRIYSNYGIELLCDLVEERTATDFPTWLERAVLEPLGLSTILLEGSPAHGASGSAEDLAAFGRELLAPTLLSEELAAEATTVQFPGLSGVLPGYGRQKENDWGLGFEIRDHKDPHWTGSRHSPSTFGHFGQSGSFLWVDPQAARADGGKGLAGVFLGSQKFGETHVDLWPGLNDALLADQAG